MNTKTPAKTVHIRPASVKDSDLLLRLITELAGYEKAADQVCATSDSIAASLFGKNSPANALICEVGGEAAGFAVYFFNYSTWQAKKGLYLEDLYVSPAFRGIGAGKHILRYLAAIAVENDCGRFEWSVLDWNKPAIDFYLSIGARPQDEWIRYRMEGRTLKNFARGID